MVFCPLSYPSWYLWCFQRWSPLIQNLSPLTTVVLVLILRCTSTERLWTALIFCGIRMRFFLLFYFFLNNLKYHNFEAQNSAVQPILLKRSEHKKYVFCYSKGQNCNMNANFWIISNYWSEKTNMVQVFESNFRFIGMNFQDICRKFEFLQ